MNLHKPNNNKRSATVSQTGVRSNLHEQIECVRCENIVVDYCGFGITCSKRGFEIDEDQKYGMNNVHNDACM